MTTPIERRQLNAFVDGELDLKSQLEIESRMESDVALRKQVDEMRQLRELVRENADYHAAPDALRRRMAALMASSRQKPAPPASTRVGGIGEAVQRWLGWRPLAASLSFAAVLAVALNLVWLQSSRDERLTDDVVASHVRATLGQHLVDVASSDRHTVKPFLSSKLGFSPPVNELRIPGSLFLGGRVDYLDGRPVAALVYKQGEHVVNSFVWPGTASESKPSFAAERGYLTAHWSHNGMNHWVISDVNREEFRAVVNAIAMADTDR
ncbi:MAG TPA: anti-sigma factor [Albitalea sp.]|uniref:anti-sigma factor family protein n=1 Tax=Piscinibacter sp. TaxID=1903157 RepID=UPI002ECFF399